MSEHFSEEAFRKFIKDYAVTQTSQMEKKYAYQQPKQQLHGGSYEMKLKNSDIKIKEN